jgi:hypothetical protein
VAAVVAAAQVSRYIVSLDCVSGVVAAVDSVGDTVGNQLLDKAMEDRLSSNDLFDLDIKHELHISSLRLI